MASQNSGLANCVMLGINYFLIITLSLIFIFVIYYYSRSLICKYYPTYPCWTDWTCTYNGTTTGTTVTDLAWVRNFIPYYKNCLVSTSGPGACGGNSVPPPEALLGSVQEVQGCSPIDYSSDTNQKVSDFQSNNTDFSYGNSTGNSFGTVYPGIAIGKTANDNRNICAQVPGTSNKPNV